jgi:hypothetical protein
MPTLGQLVVELVANTAKFNTSMDEVNSKLRSVATNTSALQQIFNTFAGVSLSHVALQLVDLAKSAIAMSAASEQAQFAFKSMADSMKVDAAAISDALRKASGDTVDFSNIARQSAIALQQGLQPDQVVRLMDIARERSVLMGTSVEEAFNLISTAVETGNTRLLKQAGIVIDVHRAMQDYARSLGVDADMLTEAGKAQAVYNALLVKAQQAHVDVNDAINQHKEALERLNTRAKEIWTSIGDAIRTAFYTATVALADFRTASENWLNSFAAKVQQSGLVPALRGMAAAPPPGAAPYYAGAPGSFTTPPSPLAGPFAPGTGPAGLGGLTGSPDLVDQARLQRAKDLAAAQQQLARTLGGLTVAQEAYTQTGANAVELIDQQLAALKLETDAKLKANAVDQQYAEGTTQRAQAQLDRIKIQNDALAKTIDLLNKRNAAELAVATEQAQSDAQAIRSQEELNAARDVGTKANMDAEREQRVAREQAFRESEFFTPPPILPGAADQAMGRLGETLAEVDVANRRFRDGLDRTATELAATERAMQELSRANAEGTDQFDRLAAQAQKLRRVLDIQDTVRATVEAIGSGLSGALTELVQGTKTVSQAFADMAKSISASLIDYAIKQGTQELDKQLIKLVRFIADNGLSGLFGLGGAAGGASYPATSIPAGESFAIGGAEIPAFQHGGIVMGPTRAWVGEGGPEAIIPLSGLGGRSPSTVVNVYNQAPGTETTSTRRTGSNGREIYDIVVRSVQQMIGNGQMDSIMSPYAMRRVPTQR